MKTGETSRRVPGATFSSEGAIALRPALFRALGRRDPPEVVLLEGRGFQRVAVVKHDSWAATAEYAHDSGRRAAVKFHRVQPLLFFPMAWLGRRLAGREDGVLQRMRDTDGFPRSLGPVVVDGRRASHAVAHEWIEGRTFKPWLDVDDRFFPRLLAMIEKLHARDIAYVDMSKWENILIGDDGRPYLLDYQIHFRPSSVWPLRWLLRMLQSADLYYLHRHWRRARGDTMPADGAGWEDQPILVRGGEALGPAWRVLRRLILRSFGVRGDPRRPV